MKNRLVPFIVFLFAKMALFAQTADTNALKALNDTGYLQSYSNYINTSLSYGTYNMQFRLSDASGLKFVFSPNEIYQTKIGVAYSFIDIAYAFSSKILAINNNTEKKGKTTRNDLAFVFRLNRFYLKLERSDDKGFYLWNTKDFYPGWKPGEPYFQFPGLRVTQTGGSLTYNSNKRFSVSGLVGGTEHQLKTAYTLLPTFYTYLFKIADEDTSVAKGKDEYTSNMDISFGLPVAASFVFAKNCYLAISAGPSIGLNFISSTLIDDDLQKIKQKQSVVSLGYSSRLSAGWSNQKFFAGIDGNYRKYSHNEDDNTLFQKRFYDASIYAGMRFPPPGFVKHSIDWVKKILPL